MTFVLTEEDHRRLVQWQRRMVSSFIGMWVYVLLVIAVQVFLDPPAKLIRLALLPALCLVVFGGYLQFSIRCPSCGYCLGRQSRLVVPERCRSCGVDLRTSRGAA